MTNVDDSRERVLKVWPSAFARNHANDPYEMQHWVIYNCRDPHMRAPISIQTLATEAKAWANAASRLPSPPAAPEGVQEMSQDSFEAWWNKQGRLFMAGDDIHVQRAVMGVAERAWSAAKLSALPVAEPKGLTAQVVEAIALALYRGDDNRWNRAIRTYRDRLKEFLPAPPTERKSTHE